VTSAKPKSGARSTAADSTIAVNEFMFALDHPFKSEIETIRRIVLGAHPTIADGIKWNVPSFRTTEYFATTHLRAKDGIGIIFHLGAKPRDIPGRGIPIEDPAKLLKWLAKDRAMIVLASMKDIATKKAALEHVVREWIVHV
jgi:Domain of unknown function (DU1801)